jgi:large subunit ribosomal protein L19
LKGACAKILQLSGWSSAISRQEHLQEREETNNMDLVKVIESENIKNSYPEVEVGDFVKAHLLIKEGAKERIQVFEGYVIARKGQGLSETITIRRVSYGIGVERILPVNSPKIDHIDVIRKGKIRRAKLYYLRDRQGKAAKITQKI